MKRIFRVIVCMCLFAFIKQSYAISLSSKEVYVGKIYQKDIYSLDIEWKNTSFILKEGYYKNLENKSLYRYEQRSSLKIKNDSFERLNITIDYDNKNLQNNEYTCDKSEFKLNAFEEEYITFCEVIHAFGKSEIKCGNIVIKVK